MPALAAAACAGAAGLGLAGLRASREENRATEGQPSDGPPPPAPAALAAPAAPAAWGTGAGEVVPVETLSVVLPCANEGEFVWRTVQAVATATPRARLREIVVVDDASTPPILEDLAADFLRAHWARVIRHDRPQGLIRSKQAGGDAALGDAVVFLDCHVKPMANWSEPIVAGLRANARRVVVPEITVLNPDTWEEVSPHSGASKCCLDWNADFRWCHQHPGLDVPIMSGGLLAMTKHWWKTTGGYDERMLSWGGENLEQSLRTWLCGGEIRVATGARVAHMFRDPRKPRTMLRYAMPPENVRRNRLRAALAWMGPWAEKTRGFPEFEDFRDGGPLEVGDLANVRRVQESLRCRGFDWYLDRFRDLYEDSGWLPASVFNLRDTRTGLCLHQDLNKFRLVPCSRDSEMQRFHEANAKLGGGCCSGIKLWDIDLCLSVYELGGDANADPCESFGDTPSQLVQFTQDFLLEWQYVSPGEPFVEVERKEGGREYRITRGPRAGQTVPERPARVRKGCLAPPPRQAPAPPLWDPVAARSPKLVPCAAPDGEVKAGQRFAESHRRAADDTFELRQPASDFCLGTTPGASRLAPLQSAPCARAAAERWTHDDGRLRHVGSGLCLDAGDGVAPGLRPCQRQPSEQQAFRLRGNGWLQLPGRFLDGGRRRVEARCLDSEPQEPVGLLVADCRDVRGSGATWARLWEEVPLETQLFRQTQATQRS